MKQTKKQYIYAISLIFSEAYCLLAIHNNEAYHLLRNDSKRTKVAFYC